MTFPCEPMPQHGMQITVSIDLGNFLGGPCPPPMPEECDDEKLTFFNENNRPEKPKGFGDAASKAFEKFGKPKKSEEESNSECDEEDEKKEKKEF